MRGDKFSDILTVSDKNNQELSDAFKGSNIIFDNKSNTLTFVRIIFTNIELDMHNFGIILDDNIFHAVIHDEVKTHITSVETIEFMRCQVQNIRLGNIMSIGSLFDMTASFWFEGKADNILMNNFICKKDIEFYLTDKCNKINISNSHFGKKLKIRNKEKEHITLGENGKIKLESLTIQDCTIGKKAYLRLGFLDCGEFILSNLRNPKDAEVNMGECIFKDFKLTNFRNMGKFKIFNIKSREMKDTTFQIDNTSIGDADFQNINLRSFEQTILFDNIFSNLHYTNIKWKDEIQSYIGDKTSNPIDIEKEQDTYRTLKNLAIKNNDRPQSLIFFAHEMKNYKKLMLEKKCGWLNGDIWTLRFNEWTNNFGLSWTRPLIVLLVLLFIFYAWLLDSVGVSMNEVISENTIEELLIFINPTHKAGFVCENQWGNLSYFIDGLFRILEGLLIYQTIQGFRKYSRNL